MTGENQSIYERLARKLEKIPPGFPRTADGQQEIRLLEWIYEPEQAELIFALQLVPEPVETIAQRVNKPAAEVAASLKSLLPVGGLMPFTIDGRDHYRCTGVIPGLQEPQFLRRDKTTEEIRRFSVMWEEYYPTFAKIGSYAPALMRIIPVSTAVESSAKTHRLEDVHRMVDDAKNIYVQACACRAERRIHGNGCNHSSEVCLLVTTNDRFDVAKWMPEARRISLEQAHQIVDKSEEEGLIHETSNTDDPNFYILCNCCSCCCVVLHAAKEYGTPHMAVGSFVASIDLADCTFCGVCKDERCSMDAISDEGGEYTVIAGRCIGCGVCVIRCPTDAIILTRRADAAPPLAAKDWAKQRKANRPANL